MRYGAKYQGVWSPETDEYIEAIVKQVLDSKNITGYGYYGYVTNVVKFLRCEPQIMQREWMERSPKEFLPFENGVLEIATGKLLSHNPGYRLTWSLPRKHDNKATDWLAISDWLDFVTDGNEKIKNILCCFANAVLKGRADLQKFLHLIGIGGSGKGTFGRLLVDLIGQENVYSPTLENFCTNRFESSNAYKKRLILFWDKDKGSKALGKFKSLTEGDYIRGEEKGKKAFQYRFDGMVLVMSNFPIFAGDNSSGLNRRIIQVPMNARVTDNQRRDLNQEFQPELAAFTNYLLSLDDAVVESTLKGLGDIPELSLQAWESRMREDSLADWLNYHVILDPTASTAIGCDRNESNNGKTPETLFGSYCQHSSQSGNSPKSHKNFSPDLLELCQVILGWEVQSVRTKTGKVI